MKHPGAIWGIGLFLSGAFLTLGVKLFDNIFSMSSLLLYDLSAFMLFITSLLTFILEEKTMLVQKITAAVCGFLFLGIVFWTVLVWWTPVPAKAQSQPPSINCSNNVGGNNSGSLSNNCSLIVGPPRRPDVIYQNSSQVGRVTSFSVVQGSDAVDLVNIRISSGVIDFNEPLELGGLLVVCNGLGSHLGGTAAQINIAIAGTVRCNVVGHQK